MLLAVRACKSCGAFGTQGHWLKLQNGVSVRTLVVNSSARSASCRQNLGHCLRTGQNATENSLFLICFDFTTTQSSEVLLHSCFLFLLISLNPFSTQLFICLICVHTPSLLSAYLSCVSLTSFLLSLTSCASYPTVMLIPMCI